ncbi:DNA-binding CsgD family transcriptional regulator [Catenulispora sp. EB89]|uniref:helix-turn-helix transcriptional regulator n=1 Tax=Catenulispora sp. EB89 TaxID=3156257 RepID=UPI003517BDEC
MDKLVERDVVEKTLARIHNECLAGRSRLVALAGPLASGKTALLESFAREAAGAGATVLAATASSLERYQPLGIVDQLLRACQIHCDGPELEVRALVESVGGAGARREAAPPALGLLHGALQRLSDSPPVIILIDDAHFMDTESLQCLLTLMRRLDSAPVSFVVTYCPDMGRDSVQRVIQAELLRMPNCTQLDIEPLSETGVAMVLEDYFDLQTAGRIATEARALSGGLPLLVHALAEDRASAIAASSTSSPAAASGSAARRTMAGPAFGRAVLSCLYRAEPVVLEIAQATATLGEFRSPTVVARLCGLDPEAVGHVAASPAVGALLDHDLLRQPSVREAVLRSIPQHDRHPMRSRAARLLHQEGAPALVTAEHLMRIDEAIPWARQVLCEAAEQTLADGRPEAAIGYLERAHRESAGGPGRIATAAKLAEVMWRHNPAAVKSYLPDLLAAAEQGELSAAQSVPVVRSLLWNGQVEQATRVIARLRDAAQSPAGHVQNGQIQGVQNQGLQDAVRYAELLRTWLPLTYPGIAATPGAAPADSAQAGPGTPDSRAAAALGALLRGAGHTETVPAAELVLRQALAGIAGPAAALASLMVLVYSDRLDEASVWCDALRASMGEAHGIVWYAMFTAARAEIHYRRGDLANAKAQAHAAFTLMPREGWGAAIVIPLSLLVLTSTAMGDLAEAESHLAFPVPSAAFGTLGGAAYLDARGQFHLARGRHDAAVQDFLAAGHLLKVWGVDCPSAVPWRVHAARAYLHKGLSEQAEELLAEQLSLLPADHPRARGLAYRALAATLRPQERSQVLQKAATSLDSCGDALNLAYTLADLSRAHESVGEIAQARAHAQKAKTLAERCLAVPLPEPPPLTVDEGPAARSLSASTVSTVSTASQTSTSPQGSPDSSASLASPARRLSTAEWRVAELAARGSTNEQIARKLFITVSTVEQHLTSSYRKLGICRRTQLRACLPELVS